MRVYKRSLQTVSMFYKYKGKEYLLNLIDTPVRFDWQFISLLCCFSLTKSIIRGTWISATKYHVH